MADHPYCEDCRFFRPGRADAESIDALQFGHCGNVAAQEPLSHNRFVSGKLDLPPTYKYAGIFREFGACGPEGKLFEPRAPEQVAA